jgi:hypothetical protein
MRLRDFSVSTPASDSYRVRKEVRKPDADEHDEDNPRRQCVSEEPVAVVLGAVLAMVDAYFAIPIPER